MPAQTLPSDVRVDKSSRRIRQMFGEISPRYDLMNHVLSGGVDVSWRRKAVRSVPVVANEPILDVCTGTGDLALAWWKRHRVPVVASDFTHEMLQIADAKIARRRRDDRPSIEVVEADAQSLPFADDSFQVVSVAFGLRNIADTQRGLAEMIRVCRPGGYVVILEFSMPRNRLLGGMYRWYFRHVLPRLGQLFARNRQSAYHYLPASVSEFPHGQELADLLTAAGLKEATFKPLTFGVATLYTGRKQPPSAR